MTERVTLDLTEHTSTDDAYLLSQSGAEKEALWVPKQFCAKAADGRFEVEKWKARELGWLAVRAIDQMRLF